MGEKEVRDRVNEYIHQVLKYFDLKLVVLYGSFAKGDANENSDIDIAVFIDKDVDKRNHLEDSATLNRLIYDIDYRIEPVLYYSNELESLEGASFVAEILNTGVILFKN